MLHGNKVKKIHFCPKKELAALYDALNMQTELFVGAIFAMLENLT
jgi:hypothetical protein